MTEEYLRLDHLLFAPPAPPLIALVLTAGVVDLSLRLAQRLRLHSPMERFAAAASTLALLCTGLHALVLAGLADVRLLRLVGLVLAVCGLRRVLQSGRRAAAAVVNGLADEWFQSDRLGKALVVGTVGTLSGLYLAALGPATDADSMDNHLGVPLDWLRHGHAALHADWLTAKLVGIGEAFSMLGLACGTDSAWATLQATALVAFVLAIGSLPNSARGRRFLMAAVSVSPVVLFLTPSQKPMLLPTLATTAAVLLITGTTRPSPALVAVVSASLAFAVACKHSFLLSGIVAIGLLVRQWRPRMPALSLLAATALVIVGPLYVRNLMLYGDPLSPMLERFRAVPSPDVLAHAQFLRESGQAPDWTALVGLIVPFGIGDLSSVIGVGLFGLAAFRPAKSHRPLLWASAALVVLIGALGQVNGRFLFEPYLWALAGLAGGSARRSLTALAVALAGQGVVVAVAALLLAGALFPGSLTARWRERVMSEQAIGYLEARWLDRLPPDAIVTTGNRSRALLPRAFFVALAPETGFTPPAAGLEAALRAHGVSAVVLPSDERLWRDGYASYLRSVCAIRDGPPRTFPEAARNPFNRRGGQSVQLYVARECAAQ
jgi:hypothetical protein